LGGAMAAAGLQRMGFGAVGRGVAPGRSDRRLSLPWARAVLPVQLVVSDAHTGLSR
jgi:hypothetical protein